MEPKKPRIPHRHGEGCEAFFTSVYFTENIRLIACIQESAECVYRGNASEFGTTNHFVDKGLQCEVFAVVCVDVCLYLRHVSQVVWCLYRYKDCRNFMDIERNVRCSF